MWFWRGGFNSRNPENKTRRHFTPTFSKPVSSPARTTKSNRKDKIMSMLNCYLAAEKEKDGKEFTICEVSTYFNVQIAMIPKNEKKKVLSDLYSQFGSGEDKTEKGATLKEIEKLSSKSNGGIYCITKTGELHKIHIK